MTDYRRRDLAPATLDALRDMPVVVVSGLRQAGKTTFLQHEPGLRDRRFVSLDDFAQLAAAQRNPETFVAGDEPLTIDEAQRCPALLTAIKREVDRRRRPGRFLLSGSANFALLRGISETLAGRAVYLALHPFSRREIAETTLEEPFLLRFFDSGQLPERRRMKPIAADEVLRGGMPSVALGQVRNTNVWFRGYEQTYLERDVRELSQVGDLIAFRHLLRLAALRSGQILRQSELARDAKLNATTAGRYLRVMEASFVLSRVGPWLSNRASRLIKSPKLYVGDAGLAAFLAGVENLGPQSEEPLRGALFETYVAQNLAAILAAWRPQARLAFFAQQGRREVDFVIEVGRDTLAIEVKAASRWDDRELGGLEAFLSVTRRCRAAILAYNGTEAVQLGDRLWAIPLGLLLG